MPFALLLSSAVERRLFTLNRGVFNVPIAVEVNVKVTAVMPVLFPPWSSSSFTSETQKKGMSRS